MFESLLERIAARHRPREAGLVEQVEGVLVSALPRGVPRIAEVAAQLNMTVRTLQRRLEQAGWGYADLLDATRQRLAEQLLRRAEASVTEVAFLLGYDDPNSFTRAFHTWTGTTPEAFRRQG